MSDGRGALSVKVTPAALGALFLGASAAAFTRLEPQSVSGDPTPGLEARVHDPLWMLARQWQLGEFHGEDAGTPIAVHVSTETIRAGAWQPGDPAAQRPVRVLAADARLDPLVEREPTPAEGPGLRLRAESGAQLLDDLADAGITGVADALVAACPLAPPAPPDPYDAEAPRLALLLTGRVPDGEAAALALEAAAGAAPAWLAGANDPASALTVATAWLAWHRGGVAPRPDPTSDSWIPDRLEYRFSVRLERPEAPMILRAPTFEGGRVDWYAFDWDVQGQMPASDGEAAGVVATRHFDLLATPLRFAGMPADRYWQYEDGGVNLGMLESQPHDLARLCLAEFAMIYGNDWLVVPVDIAVDALTTVTGVSYTTTFGERITVAAADDGARPGRFQVFGISRRDGAGVAAGVFVPPSALAVQEGRALEDVLFLRDETAAMAWAIERVVQGPSGDPRSRGDEPPPPPIPPGTAPGADLDYLLETEMPDHWIPFVTIAVAPGAIALRKGAMLKANAPVLPRGILLRPTPLDIQDEELAREGVRVRRVPALARHADGSYERWIGRRVTIGRGEGSSGLAFDDARPRVASSAVGETQGVSGALPDTADPTWDPVSDPALPAPLDYAALPSRSRVGDPAAVAGDVKLAQAMLNAALPGPPLTVDGNFGPLTEAAVQVFQASRLLPSTGVIDTGTWFALALASPFPLLEPGPGDPPMAGPPVAVVQGLLNLAGAVPALDVDGVFSPATRSGVQGFQTAQGLGVTGTVTPETWVALGRVSSSDVVPATTMRMTFSYDSEDWAVGGPLVRLVSREDLAMTAPLSDDVNAPMTDRAGFWYELQDGQGGVLYRRGQHMPIELLAEVPADDTPDALPSSNPIDAPRGTFELLAPVLPDAVTLVLFSSPLDAGQLAAPATAIASFALA